MTDEKRDRYLRRKYGITLAEYNAKLAAQGDRCDVCRKHKSEFKKNLAVDHNHKTNKIRGLLCGFCNHRLVGKYTLETATKIYLYLLKHEGKKEP